MGRLATLDEMLAAVRERADIEGADERHPDEKLIGYINLGGAALMDLIIEVRGRAYFRNPTPHIITTEEGVTRYPLPERFYRLISVRLDRSAVGPGMNLHAFTPQQEPALRYVHSAWPTHYELQAGWIEILPRPPAGLGVVVEYIPAFKDLSDGDDILEGYDGWDEYVICWAARRVAIKDQDWALARELKSELAELAARIQKLAPHRDAFRAERVKDTRQTRLFVGRRRGLL